MKVLGRGKRASVRLLGSLVGGILIVGLTAVPAAATHTVGAPTPNGEPVGCEVTIPGTLFTDISAVTIDGFAATFQVISATQIAAVVPVGAAGNNVATVVTKTTTPGVHTATDSTFDVGAGTCPVTVTNSTPAIGFVGTSVVITGTGFAAPATVKFNQTTATGVVVNSANQITVPVPSGATTGPIRVTVGGHTARSSANFTVLTAPTPTITSFTPTFGPTGTSVKITGTNFSGTVSGATFTTSSVKFFNNISATTFHVDSATQITATVPTGATTGKISVTTPGGTATSATNFTVSAVHSRSVTLSLKKHLVAKGAVSVGDTFTACAASVPVKIQRKTNSGWKNVGSTTTSASGSYSKKIKDNEGKYRAKAPKVTLNDGVDICSGDNSPVRKHND